MSFQLSMAQKIGICIPVVGVYFFAQCTQVPVGLGYKADLIELAERIIHNHKGVPSDIDTQQTIIREFHQISCAMMVQGILSIISAVFLFTLGGIIATGSAVVLGAYGSFLVIGGGYEIYRTIGLPRQKEATLS